jgi:hypothetical protein|nr:MAG TPA: hypothetical protein [Caudoviricetes sp.]
MSLNDEQINEMVDNLYDYICEDTKLAFNSMHGKVRMIKGHKFLENIKITKNTSLTTKNGLNSTQLHLNHVRRIQVD